MIMKAKGYKKPMVYIGNALMALSFFMLVVIYLPVFNAYFFPKNPLIPPGAPFITIQKINAIAPIFFDVNPWDDKEYKEVLQKGIAHAKGTAKPGEKGTIYLFAHSSDLPWRITRYNTIFLKLNSLKNGDGITISGSGTEYRYKVTDKKIVSPKDIQYLANSPTNQLILQTCWPIGTDWNRLLVFAEQIH